MTRAQGIVTAGAAFAIGLALVATGPGCARPGPFTADNVLLLSVGGLRADRLGCGGDPAARTPGWDRLAREGSPFRTCVSLSPLSRPALATLTGGLEPRRHGARTADGRAVQDEATLAQLLGGVGLETGAFTGSADTGGNSGLGAGFDRFDAMDRSADDVATAALGWLDSLGSRKGYFLWAHLADPARAATAGAYRSAIASTDRTLLRLLRTMETTGDLDRTMVVATADHGLAFGEHGERGSGRLLHDTTLRVPLVAWGPLPFRGGGVRDDFARTTDVLPTVLEAMRVATTANRPGRALQTPLKPYKERALEVVVETFPGPGREGELRAVRTTTQKYVFGDAEALYDLTTDPGETRNLVAEQPREAARLSAHLQKILGDDLARPKGLAADTQS